MERDHIPPGDSIPWIVQFNSGTYPYTVVKRPRFATNADSAWRYVTIVADVAPDPSSRLPITHDPLWASLYRYHSLSVDSVTIEVTNTADSALGFEYVEMPSNLVEFHLTSPLEPGVTQQALLCVTPQAVDSEFVRSITIEFDDLLRSRFSLPVRRTVE